MFSKCSLFKKNRAWKPLGGVIRFAKKTPSGQVCARTVGERGGSKEPWENRGRTGRVKRRWENRGGCTEKGGRTVAAAQRQVGEPWGLHKEPLENGGRTVGIWVQKSNDLVVAQNQNRGRTVGIDQRTMWEIRGDWPKNRGRTVVGKLRTVEPKKPKQTNSSGFSKN